VSRPPVSVILAVVDEASTIDAVIDSLSGQDYDGSVEIVVADGGSRDGTLDILRARAQRGGLVVIDNPGRRQSPGLNRAAETASGEILIRADGHTVYAPDYVRRSVEALGTSEQIAVGGPMNPVGTTPFGEAVASAMGSRMTMPARFHHAESTATVDTVYLGAFRRDPFLSLDGFRSFPSGAAEDADFYARWRRSGRTVIVDPDIRSTYTPRGRPGPLIRQYFSYGQGKAEMLWANGRFPSARPLAPALLMVGLLALGIVWLVSGIGWPLLALLAAWVTWLGIAALRSPRRRVGVFAVSALMQLSYGTGLLWGLGRGPWPVRNALEG
jgi:glycosyltransferase involved in cell wall biosynthesis